MLATELLLRPFSAEWAESGIPSAYMIPPVIQVAVIICTNYTKLRGDSEGSVDIARLLRRRDWSNYSMVLPLADTSRPTTAFIPGLSKFIRFFRVGYTALRVLNDGARNLGRMLALSLATSSDLCCKAGTLCDAIYRRQPHFSWETAVKARNILNGEWSLVVLYVTYSHAPFMVRYAFVSRGQSPSQSSTLGDDISSLVSSGNHQSPDQTSKLSNSPSHIIIADFETFLRHAIPGEGGVEIQTRLQLLMRWRECVVDRNTSTMCDVELCRREEIETYLRSKDFGGVE